MTESRHCPRCGADLPAGAPAGLCPNCLFQLALDPTTASFDLPDGEATLLAAQTAAAALLPGTPGRAFGDYELLGEIARGGMGIVYKARQVSLNRTVALKLLQPSLLATDVLVRRFRTEAEAAANLQHPNIVAIHEVGAQDGLHFFSMDYVAGPSLAELVRDHPLAANTAAQFVKTIAEAIEYAHRHGVLHRDLKPSNILLDHLSGQVRVTDFGLAKRIEVDSKLTATGEVLGTPSYMSPEQAAGKSNQLGPASDVYSLGAILYELLTGRPPFQAATPLETAMLVLKAEPASPRLLNPKLDRDLETICLKCLEKEPRKRYRTAQELAEDLGRYLKREPIKARAVSALSRAWRWCRRHPWPAAAAAALIALALVAMFSALTFRQRLWQSLFEQARAERLAGNRAQALRLLGEAARIKRTAELRQEAIQTITTPGVLLRHEIPFGSVSRKVFSPDAKLLAVYGSFEEASHPPAQSIKVWEMSSGRPLARIDGALHTENEFAFSPTAPLLAVSQVMHQAVTRSFPDGSSRMEYPVAEGETVRLWDPATGQRLGEVKRENRSGTDPIRGPLIFRPDGALLVKGNQGGPLWLLDVFNRRGEMIAGEGRPIAFISAEELLLNDGERLRLWNTATRERHYPAPDGMALVALSPGGHVAALHPNHSARQNDPLTLWDLRAGKQIGLIPALGSGRPNVALSADGRLIAMQYASDPQIFHLWEQTPSGLQRRPITLSGNSKVRFDQMAFSPDGSLLAALVTEGARGGVRIWETQNGRGVAVLRNNHSATWSSDSRLLATSGPGSIMIGKNEKVSHGHDFDDGFSIGNTFVNVWEVTPPTPAYLLPRKIDSLVFSSDGKQLFSDEVKWEVEKTRGRLQLRSPDPQFPERATIIAQGDQLWAVRLQQHGFPIRLRQLSPLQRELTLENPGYSGLNLSTERQGVISARPTRFAFTPDEKFLVISADLWWKSPSGGASSSGEGVLEFWDLNERKRLAIWNAEEVRRGVSCLAISSAGGRVTSCTNTNSKDVIIWDVATGKRLHQIPHSQESWKAIFSPDGRLAFFAGWQGIIVHEVETGRELGTWEGHQGLVNLLAISSDGRYLASGGEDRTIRLWEVKSGRELARLEAHQTDVTALAFGRDGQTLASGSADGTLKLWDLAFIRQELSALGLAW